MRKITRRIMKKLKICKRMPTIMIVTKDTLKNMTVIKIWERKTWAKQIMINRNPFCTTEKSK